MSVVGRLADRVTVLQAGRVLVEGPYAEVRADDAGHRGLPGERRCCALRRLSAWYGEAQVLRDVTLEVGAGEVVTLCGRNGAGKTTLLRCVMGLHPPAGGRITLDGRDLSRLPAHRRARLGLGWVPDDRGTYATLTVAEHLTPAAGRRPRRLVASSRSTRRSRRCTPAATRPATKLSGGEQQMLALARVLRMGARLLLCDEPTEGLSPLLVQQIGEILRQAKEHGVDRPAGRAEPALRHHRRRPALPARRGADRRQSSTTPGRERERELLAYLAELPRT